MLIGPKGTVIADSYAGEKYLGPQHVLAELKKKIGTPQKKQPRSAAKPKPSSDDTFIQRFTLNGLGRRGDQNIAVINGKVASVGTEIDLGVVVEKITDGHVVLLFEGKRYPLHPQISQPPGTNTPPPSKKQ